MNELDLQQELELLFSWAKNNSVKIFPAEHANLQNEISFHSNGTIDEFLGIFNEIKPAVAVIIKSFNDLTYEEDKEIVNDYKEHLTDIEQAEFERSLKVAQDNAGNMVDFQLLIPFGGSYFSYTKQASWAHDYFISTKYLAFYQDREEIEKEKLLAENVDELVIEINSDSVFQKGQNRSYRFDRATDILKAKGIVDNSTIYKVLHKAENHFVKVTEPSLNEQLKNQILELKGKKLTKVAIASQLGITVNKVNKFYHA